MGRCQIQIEAYEKGQSDTLDEQVFELDEDGILEAFQHMRELSAEHGKKMTHFDVQIICDGSYHDGASLPPFKKDFGGMK